MKAIFERFDGAIRQAVIVREGASGYEIRDADNLMVAQWRRDDMLPPESLPDGGRRLRCRGDSQSALILAAPPPPTGKPLGRATPRRKRRTALMLAILVILAALLAANAVGQPSLSAESASALSAADSRR